MGDILGNKSIALQPCRPLAPQGACSRWVMGPHRRQAGAGRPGAGGRQAMKPREAGALQHPPTMQRGVPEPQRLHLPSGEPDACPASLTRVRSPQNKDLSPHGAQRDGSKPVFLPPCSRRRPFASGTYFVLRRLCKGFGNVVFPLHGVGNGSAARSARRGLPVLSGCRRTHGLHVGQGAGAWTAFRVLAFVPRQVRSSRGPASGDSTWKT